jgi:hypothetical protein
MVLKPVSELMKEIIAEYNQDPLHWHMLRSKDSRNHINTFISHDNKKLWQLKTEWKTPMVPVGIGKCVKRNLNDEIQDLMQKGSDLPISEFYPNNNNVIITLGLGKYSKPSTDKISKILQDSAGYPRKVEKELNLELEKILKKEQLLDHYY